MKQLLFSIILGGTLILSCADGGNHIGKQVDTQKAISVKEGLKQFQSTKKPEEIVVYGKVADVCQSEGCWFQYEVGDSSITVDFNNEFTVPKNIKRKDMYAVGHFYNDTVSSSEEENSSSDTTKAVSVTKVITKFRAHGVKFK